MLKQDSHWRTRWWNLSTKNFWGVAGTTVPLQHWCLHLTLYVSFYCFLDGSEDTNVAWWQVHAVQWDGPITCQCMEFSVSWTVQATGRWALPIWQYEIFRGLCFDGGGKVLWSRVVGLGWTKTSRPQWCSGFSSKGNPSASVSVWCLP
jgi:hypothetical protein